MNSSPPKPREREPTSAKTSFLALSLDMEKYLGQLEDWDVDEEQKREFVITLWNLLVSCAEIGLQIHPVQRTQMSCGQLGEISASPTLAPPDSLYSSLCEYVKEQEISVAQTAPEGRESRL